MSVGMNRVWSLYLMLQIACNIEQIHGIFIPESVLTIVHAMYNVSNFKLFQTDLVKEWLRIYVFGTNRKLQAIIFEQGILVTGLIGLSIFGLFVLFAVKVIKSEKLSNALKKKIMWSPVLRGQI
jgi:hypothetical protein